MLTALDSGMTDIANYSIEEGAKNFDAYLHTTPHKILIYINGCSWKRQFRNSFLGRCKR